MEKPVGFIGLGIMGKPMALNLLEAGVPLMVNDLRPEAEEALTQKGAIAAPVKQIAECCDMIFMILPNGTICREMIAGSEGLAAFVHQGTLVVDMSSVTPVDSRFCAEKLAEVGAAFLDAPVSGGEEGAIHGTLAIMVGGDEEAFQKARPYFEIMGSEAVLVGGTGSGSVTKLANQMIVNLNIAAVSEALVFAHQAGVDPERVFLAIRGGLAGSRVLEDKAPRMLHRDFVPGGSIAVNHKDIKNAVETAHALAIPVPMSAALFEMMQNVKLHGGFTEDHSAMIRYFERLAGIDSI